MTSPLQRRKELKDEMLELINAKKRINISELCSKFSQDTGLRFVTLESYIKELEAGGFISVRGYTAYKIEEIEEKGI